ncbi:MarR family winged helix-turn-helix transcriptional regulator [Ruegeria sp.]|uniref:MarR family winged helix-turn-helix transcriptional regulator n=1 Tax=Ruegeria sp. TaxID=1879320 RepID=UPI003C7A92B1
MPSQAKNIRNMDPGSIDVADFVTLDSHLCFALYAASNHMTRIFSPFLRDLGVTYPQYLVLIVLWERGAQGVGELSTLLKMELGSLSPMLKRLENKKLITRRRQPTDERRVLVELTPEGEALREQAEKMLGDFFCYLNIPAEELFSLRDRLHDFVSSAGPSKQR